MPRHLAFPSCALPLQECLQEAGPVFRVQSDDRQRWFTRESWGGWTAYLWEETPQANWSSPAFRSVSAVWSGRRPGQRGTRPGEGPDDSGKRIFTKGDAPRVCPRLTSPCLSTGTVHRLESQTAEGKDRTSQSKQKACLPFVSRAFGARIPAAGSVKLRHPPFGREAGNGVTGSVTGGAPLGGGLSRDVWSAVSGAALGLCLSWASGRDTTQRTAGHTLTARGQRSAGARGRCALWEVGDS